MLLNLLFRTASTLGLCVLLGACSWFKDSPPEYLDSVEAEPLSVPDDLDKPRYRSPLVITAPPMRLPEGDELNPGPPRVVSTGGGAANAFMAWGTEGAHLVVKDDAASVARRLGLAIEGSGMQVLARDAIGGYHIEYIKPAGPERSLWDKMTFWNNDESPDYSGNYRTRIDSDGEVVRVWLMQEDGAPAPTGAAEHVLGLLMERLG